MASLLPQSEFLGKYRITKESFEPTGLVWADLEAVHAHYTSLLPDLESAAETISNQLMKVDKVHSVRYRTKDAEHLIEKIIRKRTENPGRVIELDNYLTQITDLIGLRAIHLYKEDWLSIHQAIDDKWDLKNDNEDSKAYIREGDNEAYQNAFREAGLAVKTHPRGYRSIHYIAKTKPAKREFFAEIQVRTIFEEGWSEIDHDVMYPYDLENPLYNAFSLILNRLAGNADEMGSFITQLREEVRAWESEKFKKQAEVERLQALLDKPTINKADKEDIKKSIDYITARSAHIANLAKASTPISALGGSLLGPAALLGDIAKSFSGAGLGIASASNMGTSAELAALRSTPTISHSIFNPQQSEPTKAAQASNDAQKQPTNPEPPEQTNSNTDETEE